jgi:hypothetical protein
MNQAKRQGLTGRMLRDLVLPIILKKASRPEEMTKMSWMFGHHIEWKQPVTA